MNKIPKKIYQTWENKQFSVEFQNVINLWKINNPDYEYYLYDNAEREQFIKDNFELNVYNAYCRIIPGAYKADLWRYCLLYKQGGVYVDIDTLCLGSIDTFLNEKVEFMTVIDLNVNPLEGSHNLFNAFIATIPNHEIMLNCINAIVYNIEHNIIPDSKLDFSGPGMLGSQTNNYLKLPETNSFIGKEGLMQLNNNNLIHFLKFEEQHEVIIDLNSNLLFQNQNGNLKLKWLYHNEIQKLNQFIFWQDAVQILQP